MNFTMHDEKSVASYLLWLVGWAFSVVEAWLGSNGTDSWASVAEVRPAADKGSAVFNFSSKARLAKNDETITQTTMHFIVMLTYSR